MLMLGESIGRTERDWKLYRTHKQQDFHMKSVKCQYNKFRIDFVLVILNG